MPSKRKLQLKAKILYNKREKDNFWRLAFMAPQISGRCLPGQFLSVRLTGGCQPLLRRPFSIHRAEGKSIEILYQVVGKGTEILSQKNSGEYLDVIGPLGNGFELTSIVHRPCLAGRQASSIVLIAGGMGAAPLIFLQEKLREIQNPKSLPCRQAGKIQTLVLIGAKNKNQILCEKEFRKLGCAVKISTDDGSKGFKGKVTQLLEHLLSSLVLHPSSIYGCGPRPMLKEISRICRQHNIRGELSLEEHMACGIGACLGCVVNTSEGYKTVCKDGPVFDAARIIW